MLRIIVTLALRDLSHPYSWINIGHDDVAESVGDNDESREKYHESREKSHESREGLERLLEKFRERYHESLKRFLKNQERPL